MYMYLVLGLDLLVLLLVSWASLFCPRDFDLIKESIALSLQLSCRALEHDSALVCSSKSLCLDNRHMTLLR